VKPQGFRDILKWLHHLLWFLAAFTFTFWGLWKANDRAIRIACGSGFLFGLITLLFSGQRLGSWRGDRPDPTATNAPATKNIGKFVSVVTLASLLGYILVQQSSGDWADFLWMRYSVDHGLSGRNGYGVKRYPRSMTTLFLAEG